MLGGACRFACAVRYVPAGCPALVGELSGVEAPSCPPPLIGEGSLKVIRDVQIVID